MPTVLPNFQREVEGGVRKMEGKTMSKDTERDVLICKRLEEELIKAAAGESGRKC